MRWKLNFRKYTIQGCHNEEPQDVHIKTAQSNSKETTQKIDKKAKEKDIYEDDYVAKSIGAFGRWQLIYIAITTLVRIISCWNVMSILLLAPVPRFVCETFQDNATVEVSNNTCYDNCVIYKFEKHVFEYTFVSEFGLICDEAWKASFIQTVMMFGVMCGAFLYGWLSDRYGRSKLFVVGCFNTVSFMFALLLCKSYWTVTTMRFLSGIGSGGMLSLVSVYGSELVGTKHAQTVLISTISVGGAIILLTMPAIAYLMSSWRTFTLIYSCISILFTMFQFFLPETPRWLITNKKTQDAIVLMTKAAKFNKFDHPNIAENVTKHAEKINEIQSKRIHLTYLDLFRTKKLVILNIAALVSWINTGLTYFGLVQYISQFGSNIYIVVFLLGVVHAVAPIFTFVAVNFCGRKTSCMSCCILIAAINIALIFTPKQSTGGVILGIFGMITVCVLYIINYVYAIELYPTSVRSMGISLCSVGSYVAAMLAPFVVNMLKHMEVSLIFASISFAAALFCLLLPETKGKTLKDAFDTNDKC